MVRNKNDGGEPMVCLFFIKRRKEVKQVSILEFIERGIQRRPGISTLMTSRSSNLS